ncbi:MAG: type III pantothenate kinase [Sedimenticola sp.]
MSPLDNTSSTLLLIDIGNTNIKWAWLQGGELSRVQSAAHGEGPFARVAAMSWGNAEPPDRVVVANVAGAVIAQELSDWTEYVWELQPETVVATAQAQGVTNAYENPAQLGIDRWLTLVAARRLYSGAVCVVDCGTAITADVMDASGVHRGGVILPGFEMMRQALLEKTNIPRVGEADIDQLLARDTATAVASAALHSAAGLVERVIADSEQTLGDRPMLYLTGSGAVSLQKVLSVQAERVPDLVMSGLALLATDGAYSP